MVTVSRCEREIASMDNAHEGMVWSLAWHPLGHILCSGSNDHTSKFWTRNRPGDTLKDRYNTGYEDGDIGKGLLCKVHVYRQSEEEACR